MTQNKIYLMRPFVGAEELEAVKAVFESKYLTEGPMTAEFERQFADFVGAKHAIAVTSCMTGLVLALDALGVGNGDEVIIPDFTHPATGDCAYEVGADAVLVDVDPRTYNITPQAIEAAITDKTACIIPVSWGGNPIDPVIHRRFYESKISFIKKISLNN
ncbi:MAG: aminotransferase class I/II-fold pyridoxal phosphate-dependent enzyme [Candidatus Thermoplasmatota archaeon]|nr:aminotransferase class I/II-fold pyridoxal phosphate-dependent enzyme [Candidatus Thermoplasmatota archaeon]